MFHLTCGLSKSQREIKIWAVISRAVLVGDLPKLHDAFVQWNKLASETPESLHSERDDNGRLVSKVDVRQILWHAVKGGHASVVGYLLHEIDEKNWEMHYDTVQIAVKRKNWAIVNIFLHHGWDINDPSYDVCNGGSILAALVEREECVRGLLELGADPRGTGRGGSSRLTFRAGGRAPVSVLRMLREYGIDFKQSNALHAAARYNSAEAVAYLSDEGGVPINQIWLTDQEPPGSWINERGDTPLHYASRAYNSVHRIKLLLAMGADRTIRNANGDLPIDLATWEGVIAALEAKD
ncbi:hypothetical protein FDECE_662 [Fusarium decemcellulare]|nr:hypothetical protein FDECE_662 [Fusarium decemcellulare]